MEDGKFNVLFSKKLADSESDLFKYNSIKELSNYINNRDAEIEKVKLLIMKANRELRSQRRQLYIRKANARDKDAENRICMITN